MNSSLAPYFKTLTATKQNRLNALDKVLSHPETIPDLMQLAFDSKADRENIYAAWVWELYILDDLNRLTPHIVQLLESLGKITHSSMRRSHSKILWYYSKNKFFRKTLSKSQKQKMIQLLLDWIITENKTAPLSFSIKTLDVFQSEFPIIRSHLEDILIHSKRTFPKGVHSSIRFLFGS
ncbi:MAG: hypothetical protein VW080_10445 [Flavobacteriaceae bacterium]